MTKTDHGYVARIALMGETVNLGHFDTAEEADRAYDEAARQQHGEYAVLNFPNDEKLGKEAA